MVDGKIKTQTLGCEVAAFLRNSWVDDFLQSREQEVAGSVIFDGLLTRIGQAALEHTSRRGFATLALLGESVLELDMIILGQFEADFVSLFHGELKRKTIGILELE